MWNVYSWLLKAKVLVASQSQKQVLLTHLQLDTTLAQCLRQPMNQIDSIYLELQGKTGTYQDYDDIIGEAATKVKVGENLYQKYTKR